MEDTIVSSAPSKSLISVILFVGLMSAIGIVCAVMILVSTKPPKKTVEKYYENFNNDFYFFYMKATAYRMLFNTHTLFSNTLKIANACTTFIIVYCAMIDETYILLFSMLSALGNVIALTIPFETYARIYVEAARELENAIQSEDISKQLLLDAYNRAEKNIKDNFM